MCITLFSVIVGIGCSNDELRLVRYLLDRDRYDVNVRPVKHPDDIITVEIGLALNQIIDLVSIEFT